MSMILSIDNARALGTINIKRLALPDSEWDRDYTTSDFTLYRLFLLYYSMSVLRHEMNYTVEFLYHYSYYSSGSLK